MSLNHRHVSDQYANNWLFRKLFLLRKLYLSRTSRQYFGQMAEDVAISRFLEDTNEGFYVDVGCYHPVKYSNTWKLYKKGWRGVNIDVDSIKIEAFEMRRGHDTNICKGVSTSTGQMTMYTNGYYSPTVTLDKEFSQSNKRNFSNYQEKTVEVDTLTNILDDTKYKGRKIDLLSVDVEGHDLMVLQSLDFVRYEPKLILVESDVVDITQLLTSPLHQYLEGKGYVLVNWVGLTQIYKQTNKS